tara:strand:- start:1763 stop:3301 length:1539 start_codon:yes stop_codon:yes gene_type:complete
MASTYTTNGGLERIGTGEQAGTWGSTTNTNLDLIDRLTNGVKKQLSIAGATVASPVPLHTANGSESNGMYKVIEFTGTLTETGGVAITPITAQKLYFFKNDTSGSQTIRIMQSTGSGFGTHVDIENTKTAIVYADGAGNVSKIETGSDEFTEDVSMTKAGGVSLTLQTDATAVATGDSLGRLQYKAPNESDGAPENAVVATIEGMAVADFTNNANKTKISFKTADGAAVVERAKIESADTTKQGSFLTLTSGNLSVVDGDLIGALQFQSPLESDSGTGDADGRKVSASIVAEADATFDANTNTTDLVFKVATNGDAVEKFRIKPTGAVGIFADGSTTTNHMTFGIDSDLKIYHDGTNSYVDDTGQGALILNGSTVHLYHGGANKLKTTGAGIEVTGTITATGDITGLTSDKRLKDFKGTIPSALEKVQKLNGYNFNWNDTAKELDSNIFTEDDQVGVSAQEVLEVCPEAVKPAPVDNNYYTVQYEKLVPLLIEAIKEQQEQIEHLKASKIER